MPKLDEADRQTCIQLQRYGLTPIVAAELVHLGVCSAGQLGHEDPVRLHHRLESMGHDNGDLLQELAAAIHAARTSHWDVSWVTQ